MLQRVNEEAMLNSMVSVFKNSVSSLHNRPNLPKGFWLKFNVVFIVCASVVCIL
jgi:hypothetical protein